MQLKWLPLLLSIILLFFLIYYSDFFRVVALLSKVNILWMGMGSLLFLLGFFLRVKRWQYMLRRVGIDISFLDVGKAYVAGLFISNLTPAKIGDPVRSILLKMMKNKSIGSSVSSIFVERILDIVVTISISLIGIMFITYHQVSLWLFSAIVFYLFAVIIVIFILMSKKRTRKLLVKIISIFSFFKFLKNFRKNIEKFSNNISNSFNKYKDKRVLFYSLMYTAMLWIVEGLGLFVGFMAIGIYVNPLITIVVCSTSVLISVVTFLPGGLGSGEAINILLLTNILSITAAEVMAATMIARFFGYWLYAIIGSIIFANSDYRL